MVRNAWFTEPGLLRESFWLNLLEPRSPSFVVFTFQPKRRGMMSNLQKGTKGNFANDPKRASKAGKKGGEQSHDRQHDQEGESGRTQQGAGNIADDPKRASDAGKKGGPR
jgi:general stress protein YciG